MTVEKPALQVGRLRAVVQSSSNCKGCSHKLTHKEMSALTATSIAESTASTTVVGLCKQRALVIRTQQQKLAICESKLPIFSVPLSLLPQHTPASTRGIFVAHRLHVSEQTESSFMSNQSTASPQGNCTLPSASRSLLRVKLSEYRG